jgi:hypothetical protein
MATMKTVDFPIQRVSAGPAVFDLQAFCHVLNESALLLEVSSDSDDGEFRRGAVELAIRALRTASSVLEKQVEPARPSQVVDGPWPAFS